MPATITPRAFASVLCLLSVNKDFLAKPKLLGYILNVPTELEQGGFSVRIYTRDEHPPAHVHVWKAEGEVVIDLGDDDRAPSIKEINGMSKRDVHKALAIVEENQAHLLARWREIWRQIHG
jgi:hypothetical protein